MTSTIDRRDFLLTGAGAAAATPTVLHARTPPLSVETFPLWPDTPPGGDGLNVRDEMVRRTPDAPEGDVAWPHVGTPSLTMVSPAKPNGSAVLLIPGGGYSRVALRNGGSEMAHMFAARGIATFDLRYRLPHDGWAAGPDAPLQDAQRAIRLIRERGSRRGIDPARVAVLGTSAGGHLAARLASRAALQTYVPIDSADHRSARPVMAGLFFPVITLAEPDAHAGSRRELLGTDPGAERIRRFSAETDLPVDMPPCFVTHAANDPVVSPANSLRMFTALQAARIPAELMVFELGGHNLPMVDVDGRPHPWPELFLAFARRHGF